MASNDPQLREAQESRMRYEEKLSLTGHDRITTEIELASPFYYAEEKHQQYLAKYRGG
jgi:peptide-methionine (S)-S-oxide reductase